MRNISSWAIRNPIFPLVLFAALTLLGLVSFMRMDVNDNPDIEFPAAMHHRLPARRRADRDGDPGHPAHRGGGARNQRRRRDRLDGRRGLFAAPSSSSSSALRSTAGSTTSATPSPTSARDLPEGILEPRVHAGRHRRRAARHLFGRDQRHVARGTELVRRQHRRQAAAQRRGHGRGRAARAGSAARSGSSSIRPRCRRTASPPSRSTPSSARSTSTPPAAAPRSPAPSSRCACSATPPAPMRSAQTQISLPRRAHGQAVGDRRRPRRLCRAAQPGDDERPPGAQLPDHPGQGLFGRHRLRGGDEGAAGAREGESQGQVHRDVHQRRLCEVAISQRDGGDGRGRGARRARRLPLPSRLAGDAHLGAGHPALGDPDLLVHGPDGLLAERAQPARAQPRRGRPGRRRDRRDREYRPAHADGQIAPIRRRSTPPTRSASRSSPPPSRSSPCSCRSG